MMSSKMHKGKITFKVKSKKKVSWSTFVTDRSSKLQKTVLVLVIGFAFCFLFTSYYGGRHISFKTSDPEIMSYAKLHHKELILASHKKGNTSQSKRTSWRLYPIISNKSEDYWQPIPKTEVGSAILIDKKRYVCPFFGPRLGNLMFLYATNYGVAYDYNLTLAMANRDPIYLPFEGIPNSRKSRSFYCRSGSQTFNQRHGRIYEEFKIPKAGRNVRLNGYLQSWKYFSHSFDDLRQQFTWKKYIRDRASMIIQNLTKQNYPEFDTSKVVTVSIHIRRGDYVGERRPMADLSFIESAKGHFLKKYANVLFIVATNLDKEAKAWCTENIINGTGKSVFSGFNDRYVDMAILSMTNHIIISTGTYGWWGAFLNRGTVIHYDWIPPNYYKFRREDYIFPFWIGIKSRAIYPANGGQPTSYRNVTN